jgi:DNA-binding MarR family transcriptional regulator
VNCVRHLVRGLRLAEQQTRASTGLSAAQLFLLGQLSRADGSSLTDLAERTLTDRSSVAAVVERLEDAGLVTTGRDTADRRRVLVRITARGERTLASAPAAPTELLLVALRRMSAEDVRALCTSLGRLTDEMGLAGPPGMLFEDRPASSRSRL